MLYRYAGSSWHGAEQAIPQLTGRLDSSRLVMYGCGRMFGDAYLRYENVMVVRGVCVVVVRGVYVVVVRGVYVDVVSVGVEQSCCGRCTVVRPCPRMQRTSVVRRL